MTVKGHWYQLKEARSLSSPALLVYPDRIEHNILKMIAMAGGILRLRPHIKTHKTAEIIQMQLRHGIQKYKCATIPEAELLGACGAADILLAMQPVANNIDRFFKLMERFPASKFSTLIDNPKTLTEIANFAASKKVVVSLWMDINNGMNRTGIIPDEKAVKLYKLMDQHPSINPRGLHVYDGHLGIPNFAERKKAVDAAFLPIITLKENLESQGIGVKTIVAGGSPSFPVHAQRTNVELSPGTTLLWDARYGAMFKEMDFDIAAVLLTRIVSKPAQNVICFDLGHKSIAPEMPFPRVEILGLEEGEQIGQSEEHLVVKTAKANAFEVGDAFYAIPMHICPTVAKYEELQTVTNGKITSAWKVAARGQKISI